MIEAGPDNADLDNVHMVGGWSQNFDKDTDWNITSEPAPGINGRQVKNSRGRFLGGCSGVNGTLCIRGNKQDYDDWGLEGWTGEDMWENMAKVSWGPSATLPRIHISNAGTSRPLIIPFVVGSPSRVPVEVKAHLRAHSTVTRKCTVSGIQHRPTISIPRNIRFRACLIVLLTFISAGRDFPPQT